MDVGQLSDRELKEQLIKHGTVPGPILPTTRAVYEKKLKQLLDQGPPVSQARLNGTGDMEQYSDSEEEGLREISVPPRRDLNVTNISNSSVFNSSKAPSEVNQPNRECESPFSVTKLVEQMEQRPEIRQMFAHQKMLASCSPIHYNVKADDLLQLGEITDTFASFTPSPLGMSATRRKPIKGAAGRPIQFKYDDIVTQAKLVEHTKQTEKGVSRKMVPVYVQVALFVIVAFLALVFLTMENNPENPFHPYVEQVEIQHPQ